jgi:hypothetical protein
MSFIRFVPDSVPSDFHISNPEELSLAVKKRVPLAFNRYEGLEDPLPM